MATLPAKLDNGMYPACVWPGGYPLFYFDDQSNVLCVKCASKPEGEYYSTVINYDVNWEDADLYCDDCAARIESTYAEDEGEGL